MCNNVFFLPPEMLGSTRQNVPRNDATASQSILHRLTMLSVDDHAYLGLPTILAQTMNIFTYCARIYFCMFTIYITCLKLITSDGIVRPDIFRSFSLKKM